MSEDGGAEAEKLAELKDRGLLTQGEFDTWCLRHFAALPGTHLSLRKSKRTTWDLATSEGIVWAKCQGGTFTHFHQLWRSIRIQDESYRWRGVGTSFRRTHHLVARSSAETVLRMTGAHFNKRANTRVELVGQGSYEFPVARNGIMSTLDETGDCLAQYRLNRARFDPRKQIEVVVNSTGRSIPGFELVIAVSTLFLPRYFEAPIAIS